MTTKPEIDIGYVPTPPRLVTAMLDLARVTANDVVYDLGSGDGRIIITAAQLYGARGVGIDIDPERIRQAYRNAQTVNLTGVEFRQQNLFETDFQEATVVMLYLLPHLNLRLRSHLRQLRPGTRIVSRDFDMGDWSPTQVVQVSAEEEATLYYWEILSR